MVGCSSCSPDLVVNFTLNDNDIAPMDDIPTDPNDSLYVLNVMVGDTVYLYNISEPSRKVKTQSWDYGSGSVENVGFFPISFDQPGFIKITLCVNNIKPCISKWIHVKPVPVPDTSPSVYFLKPTSPHFETDDRKLDIEIQTKNVADEKDLSLTLGGRPVKGIHFDPQSGILHADVNLAIGHNNIEIIAGSDRKSIEVERASPKPIPDIPPSPQRPPVVEITKPTAALVTDKQSEVLEFTVFNVKNKNGLDITVNGKAVSDFRYSKNKKKWVANIPMNKDENVVVVTATNSTGTDKDQIKINYKPPRAKPLSNPAIVGLPLSSYKKNCNDLSNKGSFSVLLSPAEDVELESFFVYSNDCGGLEVTLQGAGDTQTFEVALLQGKKSQITFGTIDARLKKGNKYTLSCRPFANHGGCTSPNAPKLEDAGSCGISPKTSNKLSINQQGNLIIYDLKFLYR